MNLDRPEIIEAYLKGQLSAADKAAFEAQVAQDPLIQGEMDLQRDIINSLKEYRKAQLKQRLSAIEVGSAPAHFAALKIAASVILSAMLSYGDYFYLIEKPTASESLEKPEQKKEMTSLKPISPAVKEEIESSNQQTDIVRDSQKRNKVSYSPTQVAAESRESVIEPNVIDNFNENSGLVKESTKAYEETSATPVTDRISDIEIFNSDNKGKDLKYKYLNKKLYLYGDFSASPYELLEVNNNETRRLYLFHNGLYYHLNEHQKSVVTLLPIKDGLVVNELDSLKEHK